MARYARIPGIDEAEPSSDELKDLSLMRPLDTSDELKNLSLMRPLDKVHVVVLGAATSLVLLCVVNITAENSVSCSPKSANSTASRDAVAYLENDEIGEWVFLRYPVLGLIQGLTMLVPFFLWKLLFFRFDQEHYLRQQIRKLAVVMRPKDGGKFPNLQVLSQQWHVELNPFRWYCYFAELDVVVAMAWIAVSVVLISGRDSATTSPSFGGVEFVCQSTLSAALPVICCCLAGVSMLLSSNRVARSSPAIVLSDLLGCSERNITVMLASGDEQPPFFMWRGNDCMRQAILWVGAPLQLSLSLLTLSRGLISVVFYHSSSLKFFSEKLHDARALYKTFLALEGLVTTEAAVMGNSPPEFAKIMLEKRTSDIEDVLRTFLREGDGMFQNGFRTPLHHVRLFLYNCVYGNMRAKEDAFNAYVNRLDKDASRRRERPMSFLNTEPPDGRDEDKRLAAALALWLGGKSVPGCLGKQASEWTWADKAEICEVALVARRTMSDDLNEASHYAWSSSVSHFPVEWFLGLIRDEDASTLQTDEYDDRCREFRNVCENEKIPEDQIPGQLFPEHQKALDFVGDIPPLALAPTFSVPARCGLIRCCPRLIFQLLRGVLRHRGHGQALTTLVRVFAEEFLYQKRIAAVVERYLHQELNYALPDDLTEIDSDIALSVQSCLSELGLTPESISAALSS